MPTHFSLPLAGTLLAVLPVLFFLGLLLYLDSYKLVRLRTILLLVVAGAVLTVVSYGLTKVLLEIGRFDFASYTLFGSPLTEEALKALVVIYLIRSRRIGFLVDAALLGFAIGTGFATAENLYFLHAMPDASLSLWTARGFGTALMHGGATALFATIGMVMRERRSYFPGQAYVPALLAATALHSAFNELHRMPTLALLLVLVLVPLSLFLAFLHGERMVGEWLGRGFDADAELLELIDSGEFTGSAAGLYLSSLKDRFAGMMVADLLCYLRMTTELTLRAKGMLLMRENGFDPVIDDDTRDKFAELRYLEKSIGKTGVLALQPMLHIRRSDLWRLFLRDG